MVYVNLTRCDYLSCWCCKNKVNHQYTRLLMHFKIAEGWRTCDTIFINHSLGPSGKAKASSCPRIGIVKVYCFLHGTLTFLPESCLANQTPNWIRSRVTDGEWAGTSHSLYDHNQRNTVCVRPCNSRWVYGCTSANVSALHWLTRFYDIIEKYRPAGWRTLKISHNVIIYLQIIINNSEYRLKNYTSAMCNNIVIK